MVSHQIQYKNQRIIQLSMFLFVNATIDVFLKYIDTGRKRQPKLWPNKYL